jgi:hypothetical protein
MILGVMKRNCITSIISALANNEISYKEKHPGFMEDGHPCSLSTHKINAVFS